MAKLKEVEFTNQILVVLLTTLIGVIGWLAITQMNLNTTMARVEERMINYEYRIEQNEERIKKLEEIFLGLLGHVVPNEEN